MKDFVQVSTSPCNNSNKDNAGSRYKYMCRLIFRIATRTSEYEKNILIVKKFDDKIMQELEACLKNIVLEERKSETDCETLSHKI